MAPLRRRGRHIIIMASGSEALLEVAFGIITAEAESMLPLFRARNPPCSNSPARASTVLKRSSCRVIFTQSGREFYWRSYARAVSGCSVPSIFSGRPTMTASGCHSLSSFSITFQSGLPSCAFSAGRGQAVPVMRWPTATPILLVPKSKPSSVPLITRARYAGHRHNVDTDQFCRLAPTVGNRRFKQNILVRRGRQPGVIRISLLQLTLFPEE